MRQQLAEELPFPIVAKYVPMAEKNGAVTMKVMVVIEDLVGIVCHYLSQHEEAGTLYWHNALPEQEIWIKLGADHLVRTLLDQGFQYGLLCRKFKQFYRSHHSLVQRYSVTQHLREGVDSQVR